MVSTMGAAQNLSPLRELFKVSTYFGIAKVEEDYRQGDHFQQMEMAEFRQWFKSQQIESA